MGVVTALNGEEMLTAWDNEQCNRLDGSDGAFFPRHHINPTSTLYLFHKDLCRKLPLVYEKEVDVSSNTLKTFSISLENIDTLSYHISNITLQNLINFC